MKFRITRNTGFILIFIGIIFQPLNILTYGLWKFDIDLLGFLIFFIGLIVAIVRWKK